MQYKPTYTTNSTYQYLNIICNRHGLGNTMILIKCDPIFDGIDVCLN